MSLSRRGKINTKTEDRPRRGNTYTELVRLGTKSVNRLSLQWAGPTEFQSLVSSVGVRVSDELVECSGQDSFRKGGFVHLS